MVKLYQLATPSKIAVDNYDNVPAIQDGGDDKIKRFVTIDTKMTWRATDNQEEDMVNNLANWHSIVELLDLKKESDIEDVVFVGSNTASVLQAIIESRTQFIKELSEAEGCGPKRLKLLTDAFRIYVPVITKCTPGAKFRDSWTGDMRINNSDRDMFVFRRWAMV